MGKAITLSVDDTCSQLIPDIFHVYWRLTHACNYTCSYCPRLGENGNCVYVRERIMTMAVRILEQTWPTYEITLTGGEPTLHPFLSDITCFFATSGRDIHLTIETNGSQSLEYYLNLMNGLPNNSLRLSIGIHPAFADISHIITLAGTVIDHGQQVHLRLASDPNDNERTKACKRILDRLPASISFTVADTGWPEHGIANAVFKLNRGYEDLVFDLPSKGDIVQSISDVGVYCYQGANLLWIEPDGNYYGSRCVMSVSPNPLWQTKTIKSRIIHCKESRCSNVLNDFLPKFESYTAAKAWGDTLAHKRLRWEYELPALTLASGRRPTLSDLLRARLRRLAPLGATTLTSAPQSIWRKWPEITHLYALLPTETDREIFLRCVKTIERGEIGWLSDSERALRELRPTWAEKMWLCISEPISTESLKGKATVFRRQKSMLEIVLPLELDSFLEQLVWLIEEFPDYKYALRANGGVPVYCGWHVGQLQDSLRLHGLALKAISRSVFSNVGVSVIVETHNGQDEIEATIDSILLQEAEPLDLIVVDNASDDATPDILERIRKRAGSSMRVIRLEEQAPHGLAFVHGLGVSSGKAILFVQSGDSLTPDFLAKGAEILHAENADIVVFGTVEQEEGVEWQHSFERAHYSGFDSLELWLENYSRGLSISGCYFAADLLFKANIMPDASPYWDLRFGCDSFYESRKTVTVDNIGVYHRRQALDGYEHFEAWSDTIKYLNNFLTDRKLELPNAITSCVTKLYQLESDAALQEIKNAIDKNVQDRLLTPRHLLDIGTSQETLRMLIQGYAREFCERWQPKIVINKEDLDWRKAAQNFYAPKIYSAYGNADLPTFTKPKISIIMPNYNKQAYLRATLETILAQSFTDFELIIVDDHSTDKSWEILLDFADFEPRIRLYRMERNCRQGVCRNIALEKAIGKYLIFADSDDLLEPDFLKTAYEEATSTNADVLICSCHDINLKGEDVRSRGVKNAVTDGKMALKDYEVCAMLPSACAKLFRASFVRAAGCRFEEYIHHEDHAFLLSALRNASRVVFKDLPAITIVISDNSTCRPTSRKYIHFHSCVAVFDLIWREAHSESPVDLRQYMDWYFREMLLPTAFAFVNACGELPLSDEDASTLQTNEYFIKELLSGYAQRRHCVNDASIQKELLASFSLIDQRHYNNDVLHIHQLNFHEDGDGESKAHEDVINRNLPRASVNIQTKYIIFEDGSSSLSKKERNRARAILARNPDIDLVCFARFSNNPALDIIAPGQYSGGGLLRLHCAPEFAAIQPTACMLRRSFLSENNIEIADNPLDAEIMLLKIIASANKIMVEVLSVEQENCATTQNHKVAWEDFNAMASTIIHFAESQSTLSPENAVALLRKLVVQGNMSFSQPDEDKDVSEKFFDEIMIQLAQ